MSTMNEQIDKMLAQAKQLQHSMGEALSKTNDQLQPIIKEQLEAAQHLQETLSKHAGEAAQKAQPVIKEQIDNAQKLLTSDQAKAALGHVQSFIKTGSGALQESAEQTRVSVQKMVDQSKKIVESMGKK
jgi:hypothetical protein